VQKSNSEPGLVFGGLTLEVGHGIQAVNKILRHSSIITTMRYYHPDNSLRGAVESLSNFGGTATNIATNDDLQKSN